MRVYLDNAATTQVDPEVFEVMKPYFKDRFGNPSSVHSWGQEAKRAIDESRQKIAKFLSADPGEIIFTSCATESINLAHRGLIEAINQSPGTNHQPLHIITSPIEHKAVLETCEHLKRRSSAEVTYLPVDKFGMINLSDLKKAIKPNTVLVSIIYVNNEVSTIQPIKEIGTMLQSYKATKKKKIFFHTDATQAMQYLDCRVGKLGIDLLSFSGHKMHAPKGIGALYIQKDVLLSRQQNGGGQENRLRAGTENVAFIVGLAKAIELVASYQPSVIRKIARLRDKLIKGVLGIPGANLTGHPEVRAPHIASFTIRGVEGEAMLLLLDSEGIAASSGSACTSGTLKPSHVLLGMGISPGIAHGSLRFSLSKNTTKEEIDYVLKVLPKVVEKLRKMAPKLKKR
jgi:cysteine desulfurase